MFSQRRCFWLILVAFLIGFSPCSAQKDKIDEWISKYMKDHQVPGLVLAITEGDSITILKGYGSSNLEHLTPMSASTVFESASLGKTFTAAAILLLIQEGKLRLNDPIKNYLNNNIPQSWEKITIRHLLTHTSGIREYEKDSALNIRLDYREDELLTAFGKHTLLFAPGDEWSYSNSGYVLLGMIMRRLTGEHWSEFLRKKIFEPLTMPTARMISYDEIIRNRADGYEVIEGKLKNREVIGPGWNTTADGSLLLSAPDLIKWSAAIKGNSLLNEESKRLMLSPTRLNDGSLATYGLGWFLGMDSGRRVAEHGGSGWGFRTYMGLFLDDSLTVIILANSTSFDPYLVGHKIAAMIRPSLEPPIAKVIRLPTKSLQDYAGDYKFVTGEIIHVEPDSDGLVITGIPLGKVVPEAKDRFFSPAWQREAKLIFVRDKEGRVQWLYTRRFSSSPTRATRVK